jgi:hypothetical protein
MTRIPFGKYSETKVYNAVLNVKKSYKNACPGTYGNNTISKWVN